MVAFSRSENRYNLSVVPFRLTLLTGVGFPDSDLTAQSTLYWTPYGGNAVALYNGTNWREHIVTQRSLALSGLTPWRLYDVFVYDNSGTITLELTAWTAPASGSITGATFASPIVITSASHGRSAGDLVYVSGVAGNTAANSATGVPHRVLSVPNANTFSIGTLAGANVTGNGTYTSGGSWYLASHTGHARATALTAQDGVYVRSGAATRRYLGTFQATSSSTTDDSATARRLWNYYNRASRLMTFTNSSSHTYDGDYRSWNNDFGARLSFVCGLESEAETFTINARITGDAASRLAIPAIYLDGHTGGQSTITFASQNGAGSAAFNLTVPYPFQMSPGAHFMQAMEGTASTGSCTFVRCTVSAPYRC